MLTHKDNLTILKSRIIIKAKGQEQQSLYFLAFNERLSRAEIILSDPDDHSHLRHFLSRHKFGDEVLFLYTRTFRSFTFLVNTTILLSTISFQLKQPSLFRDGCFNHWLSYLRVLLITNHEFILYSL